MAKLALQGTLVLLTAAAAQAGEKFPRCFDASRDGHCVAVTVNGQKTVRLTKKTKKVLEALGGLSPGGGDTRYEVPQPVRGDLVLHADWLPEAVAYFGSPPEVTVHVLPLERQDLARPAARLEHRGEHAAEVWRRRVEELAFGLFGREAFLAR